MKTAYTSLQLILISLVSLSCGHGTTVNISKTELSDRIRGGWAGQTIGCTYGSPTEFKYFRVMPDSVEIEWSDKLVNYYFTEKPGTYDDVYMDLTFVDILEKHGLDASADKFAESFAHAPYPLWHANQAARYNILNGILPPQSGHWLNNPHADDIDFQIECDFAGLMCPGMPSTAVKYCDRVGHIMNYGDGWYGGVYIAQLYALAFVEKDIRAIVGKAVSGIPESTRFRRAIEDLLKFYDADPVSWKRAWRRFTEAFGFDKGCPSGVLKPFNIDAVLNSGYVTIGLLYGGGDFGKSIEIATRCGQDSDCNPASVGGILGVMLGYEGIPEEWKAPLRPFENTVFPYTDISLKKAGELSLKHALALIQAGGGIIDGENVRIRVQEPAEVPLEQGFEDIAVDKRLEFWKSIGEFDPLSFEGRGVVVKYSFENKQETLSEDYVAQVKVILDGAEKEICLLPVDMQSRKFDLWHSYDLPDGDHTLGLEWLNPRGEVDLKISSVIIYKPWDKALKVMSYNMLFEHNKPEQPERQWTSRCPNLVKSILKLRPDIIGSQELQSYQVADVIKGTGYARIGCSLAGTYSETDHNENAAIFYRPDRLRLLESGNFWYNDHPDTPGPGLGMSYNRMCTWGKFEDMASGKVFYLFNSHFYYEPDRPDVRLSCARILKERVMQVAGDYPVIVTGDLNSEIDTPPLQHLLSGSLLKDSRSLVDQPAGPEGSYYDFELSTPPVRRLDHILVNDKPVVRTYRIIDDQWRSGLIESDHLPVIAEIELF